MSDIATYDMEDVEDAKICDIHEFEVNGEGVDYGGYAHIEESCPTCGAVRLHTFEWDGKHRHERCDGGSCAGGGGHDWDLGSLKLLSDADDYSIRRYSYDCSKCPGRLIQTHNHERMECFGPDGSVIG